jgi:DNA-directed RNA polymerase subunit A'
MPNKIIRKKIGEIKFALFSPEKIKKISSAKIVTPELYDKEGYPVDGGLMDIRLGVIDPGLKCKTCGRAPRRAHKTPRS